MITTSAEYLNNLWKIQDANTPNTSLRIPSTEEIYELDWNTRIVKAPKYLSVAKDHTAETVYFICDRYFDTVDLSTKIAVIQYVNANNQAGIYLVPSYDVESQKDKIIFPWCITGCATQAAGAIRFSVRFYEIGQDRKLKYSIETQPTSSQILYGLDVGEEVEEEYEITASLLDEINQRLAEYAQLADLYWIDLN